jgi:hypothetical protein
MNGATSATSASKNAKTFGKTTTFFSSITFKKEVA